MAINHNLDDTPRAESRPRGGWLRRQLSGWVSPAAAAAVLTLWGAWTLSAVLAGSGDLGSVAADVATLQSLVLKVAAEADDASTPRGDVTDATAELMRHWAALSAGIDGGLGTTNGELVRERLGRDLDVLVAELGAYSAGSTNAAAATTALATVTSEIDELLAALVATGEVEQARRRASEIESSLLLLAAAGAASIAAWRWRRGLGRFRYLDGLTGLPTRRSFTRSTQRAIDDAPAQPLSVIIVGLDRFRLVNESLGHRTGDALLATVAERLAARLSPEQSLARFGGDRFLVRTALDVDRVTRVIREAFEEPAGFGAHTLPLAASIGSSAFPDDGDSAELLVARAEAAMYRAKRSGGMRTERFGREVDESSTDRLLLEGELRHAIEHDEFVLHYQPQFSATDRSLVGLEALIRWRHPVRGLIPPVEFIPMLEESDLIVRVGTWVLETACQQVSQWAAEGLPPVRVAVNVSVRQLVQPDFLAAVQRALTASALQPRFLELEITETLAAERIDDLARVFHELRSAGIAVALDDFGTGHSSLGRLRQLPISTVKIDRSFVWGMTKSAEGLSLVAAIIELSKTMNLGVVAEGVETEEQLALLQELDCDAVQGFLLSRPVEAAAIRELLVLSASAPTQRMAA